MEVRRIAAPRTCAKACCSTEVLPHGVAVSLRLRRRQKTVFTGTAVKITSMLVLRLRKCSKKKARRGVPVQKGSGVVCYLTNNADISSRGTCPGSAPSLHTPTHTSGGVGQRVTLLSLNDRLEWC